MYRCWVIAALAALSAGCGSAKYAPVQGAITVDGAPCKNLFIHFEPLAEGKSINVGHGSIGRTNEQGVYKLMTVPDKLDGALIGKHMVLIYAEGDPVDDDELAAKGISTRNRKRPKQLPARYNDKSELTFVVEKNGSQAANFELSSK